MTKSRKTVIVKMPKTSKQKKKTVKKEKQEITALGHALRTLGGLAGGGLGGLVGVPTQGGAVGTSLGAALSRWLGAGDYTVSTNSLVTKASTGIPMMHKEGQTVIVRHREFLMEVKSSSTFAVQAGFPINPGMRSTFPWMSKIARNFQQYRIRGMVYHYVPTTGTAVSSTNAAMGSVMLQTVYRATDAAPIDKISLLNEYWTGEVVPSDTLAHPVECNPKENPYNIQYIRSTDPPAGESRLMYDLGTTYVATSGQQTTGNVLGDLWVTYEVELAKPIIASDVINEDPFWGVQFNSPTDWLSGASVGASEGNLTVAYSGNTLTLPSDIRGTMELNLYFYGGPFDLGWGAMTLSLQGWTVTNTVVGPQLYPSGTTGGGHAIMYNAGYSFRLLRTSTTGVSSISFPGTLTNFLVAGSTLPAKSGVYFTIRND